MYYLSAGSDGWIVEWRPGDPETGRVLATVEAQVFALASTPALPHLVVAGTMQGGLHWIDMGRPEQTRNLHHHPKGVFDLHIQGPWLFSAGGDGTVTRWALEEARSVESFQLTNQALRTIAVAPARAEMAVGASDGSIYFLNLETLELLRRISLAHTPSVFTVRYSPDQQYLLSGGRDAMLRVWDLENNLACLSEQPAHWFTINHLAYAPGGHCFATASRDKTIKIWDAASFRLLQVLDTHRDGGHTNSVNRLINKFSH